MSVLPEFSQNFEEYNLMLSLKKCHFFQTRVCYVGHIVSEKGIEADPGKVEKVVNWPTPQNAEEVRQFVGFAGYYRKFVQDFSQVAKPLTDLMPTTQKKHRRAYRPRRHGYGGGELSSRARLTNSNLVFLLTPILGFADYSLPFELHIDASGLGLGAILYQFQKGHKRVISYASRGISKSEKLYPAHKLEFLCLKWAVTEKYNDYLYGNKFTVLTDNNPLTYV